MFIFRTSAGIYVDLETSPVPFSKLLHNVQCFIIHNNISLTPSEWTNVSSHLADLLYSS